MTSPIPFPHDRFVKKVFRRPAHAASLLRAALPPDMYARLDLSTLHYRSTALVDDTLREQFTDLLFSGDIDGRPSLLLFLVEHKSAFDRWTPLQILGYRLQIWKDLREKLAKDALLPDIVPIVLYHGERRAPALWRLRTLVVDRDGPPDEFRFDDHTHVLDLGAWSDKALRDAAADAPVAALALVLLKSIRGRHLVRKLRDCADLICAVLAKRSGERWLQVVVRYILAGAPQGPDAEEVQRTMSEIAGPRAEEIVMTAAEKLYAEGMEKGIKTGIEKGIEKGIATNQREAILKVLRARFGKVPAATDQTIRAETNQDTLDRLLELAARTKTLAEFQGGCR